MSKEHEVHCYQYVNRPYESVAAALRADALGLFRRATTEAEARAGSLAAKLKVKVAGFEVAKDIAIEVTSVDDAQHAPGKALTPAMAIDLTWHATTGAAFFPSMRARLSLYPLSGDETQLDLHGLYTPPGGVLGSAADTVVGHRIADATVHRFLDEVVAQLRAEAR